MHLTPPQQCVKYIDFFKPKFRSYDPWRQTPETYISYHSYFLCVRSMRTSVHKLSLTHATASLHSAFVCITLQSLNVNTHILGIHCHESQQLIDIKYNVNASHQNTHKYYCISLQAHIITHVLYFNNNSIYTNN